MSFPRGPLGGFGPDPDFDRGFRTIKRAGIGIAIWALVGWLFSIGLVVAIIAVAWHFIAKYW